MPAPAAGEPGGGFDGQLILPGLDLAAPGGQSGDDAQLDAVAAELAGLDGDGSRMAAAIRGALDMLLDGQHTGRYRWDQLHKSETLVPNHRAADQDGTTGRSASRDDADWIDFSGCLRTDTSVWRRPGDERDSALAGSARERWVGFHMPLRISYPGRLQFEESAVRVVDVRVRQAEPVPQAPETFTAGPGDRLLQLPPVNEISGAGGGTRHGCRIRCGRGAWALMIRCGRIPAHCGLLRWLGRAGRLVSVADELSGAGIAAGCLRAGAAWLISLWAATGVSTTHNRPQERPHNSPQEFARSVPR